MLGMKNLTKTTAVAVLALSAGFTGFAKAETSLSAGGATFPAPIYKRWIEEYEKKNPDVKINYESQGSGFGIKGITAKTLDWAGSDAPMSKKEEEAAGREILHIPTVAGAVVLAYNLPEMSGEMKLTGEIIADIYQGKISKWNDPKLGAINSGMTLPDLAITPVYRTDGSGTTFVFTNYVATQSEEFKGGIGMGKEVKFPIGQGGKGNAGVTAAIQGTKGAIGYVELNYAIENKLAFATVKNKDGQFVKASPESVTAAGANAAKSFKVGEPKGLAVNIWDQAGAEAYPISAFTYILVPADMTGGDAAKTKAIIDFITWATGPEAQSSASSMTYAPLAPAVQEKVKEAIAALKK